MTRCGVFVELTAGYGFVFRKFTKLRVKWRVFFLLKIELFIRSSEKAFGGTMKLLGNFNDRTKPYYFQLF